MANTQSKLANARTQQELSPPYIPVTIRGEAYWARRINNRTIKCWHRYDNGFGCDINDFMGYFDTVVRKWDSED